MTSFSWLPCGILIRLLLVINQPSMIVTRYASNTNLDYYYMKTKLLHSKGLLLLSSLTSFSKRPGSSNTKLRETNRPFFPLAWAILAHSVSRTFLRVERNCKNICKKEEIAKIFAKRKKLQKYLQKWRNCKNICKKEEIAKIFAKRRVSSLHHCPEHFHQADYIFGFTNKDGSP